MKRHNTLKVVLITILVLTLLTWILPAAYYSSGYVDQGRIQMGIFDLFNYPFTTLSYFGYIALYVLVIGAFYGILNKIGAYRSLLDSIVKKVNGREKIIVSIIIILLAVLTSVSGMQLALVLFFPFIISLILLMGYDKIVAALTVVGSTMIGIAGTTYGYANTNLIISGLNLHIDSQLIGKILILVLGIILLIINTMLYIKKCNLSKTQTSDNKKAKSSKTSKSSKAAKKKDEKISVEEDDENSYYIPEKSEKKENLLWPITVTLLLLLIISILAFTSWSDAFKVTTFTDATKSVTKFKVFGFELFGKLLGTVKEFGTWTVTDLSISVIVFTLLLSVIYKLSIDDIFEGAKEGIKKALTPALVVVLIYTCLVITTYHPFQLVIYKSILTLTKNFNVLTSGLVAILASIFNVDPTYTFNSCLPYLVGLFGTGAKSIIAVVFQSLYGFTMLFAPTSLILMGILSYLNISYKNWLKTIWKLLLEFIIVLTVIFIILVLA